MLKIVFNVKFTYRSATIPNKIDYFLDFSLKITVSTSHFYHTGLGVAILAAPLEKSALVCHSILKVSISGSFLLVKHFLFSKDYTN